jgi:hypothetical protein
MSKQNFWQLDLPYCLLEWSSQSKGPIALDTTEHQLLVGSMRANVMDGDLFFFLGGGMHSC